MRTTPVVTGILAKIEELLDVHVPSFEIGAYRSLAFASLIHGDSRVIDDLQKGNNALALTVGAFDVGAQCPNRCPIVTQATGKFGQHGVVLNGAINAKQIIRHRGQVAGAQLWPQRTGIKQRRCRAHVIKRRQQPIKFDGAGVAVVLSGCQSHRDSHKENLG